MPVWNKYALENTRVLSSRSAIGTLPGAPRIQACHSPGPLSFGFDESPAHPTSCVGVGLQLSPVPRLLTLRGCRVSAIPVNVLNVHRHRRQPGKRANKFVDFVAEQLSDSPPHRCRPSRRVITG